jgi:hypothetical protein
MIGFTEALAILGLLFVVIIIGAVIIVVRSRKKNEA